MMNQPETANINRVLYREWFPQIVYNHHQTGPTGTVMFAPPFRDPFNYNFDPLVVSALDLVGAAMHSRFVAEGKPGVTTRSGAHYSTWWNGGLRTTAYFHNRSACSPRRIGNPTPMTIPLRARRAAAQGRPAVADCAAGLALPPVDRLLGDRELRGAGLRARATARRCSTTSTRWAGTRIARGNRGHLDDVAEAHRRGEGAIAKETQAEAATRGWRPADACQTVPAKYFELLKMPASGATRAATSFPPTSPTS